MTTSKDAYRRRGKAVASKADIVADLHRRGETRTTKELMKLKRSSLAGNLTRRGGSAKKVGKSKIKPKTPKKKGKYAKYTVTELRAMAKRKGITLRTRSRRGVIGALNLSKAKRGKAKPKKAKGKGKKSRRKTYPTKGAAEKARTKGRSLYKVKGGWRLTKKK